MNKDYIIFLQKAKQTKNVYNPTKLRLRKKLGKSNDDSRQSSLEIFNSLENLPNKLIDKITFKIFNQVKIRNNETGEIKDLIHDDNSSYKYSDLYIS